MPELPEVETIARGVDRRLRGDRVEATWFSEKREPFKSPARTMAEILPGRRIERVFRVGKHIVFDLVSDPDFNPDSNSRSGKKPRRMAAGHAVSHAAANAGPQAVQWIVHLGMTGRLLVADPATPAPAHTHGVLRLASGRELRFVDPRRFGRMSLHLPASSREAGAKGFEGFEGFKGSGREPLAVSAEEFAALFRGRRTSIKAALLNQALLQGIGNIYADEGLYRAGIRPRRMASRLNRAELARLHASLRSVLREAISLGGSSVSDYVDADGAKGFFQLEHRVYLRTGQPCLACGAPIRRIVLAGRGTHYCPNCQK